MHDDGIARFHPPNAFAGFEHGRGGLVAKQVGKEFVRPLHAIDLAELCTADPAALHAHQNLAVSQRRNLDFLQHQRLLQFHQHGG